ncbi:hypothetical protein GZH53_06765 [Flavihumibacter sp. R14]|nr:hypothetical protein [Flavihumibacter soli]
MTIINRCLTLFLFTSLISGCEKKETLTPDPVPREIKDIEILSGNNQLAHRGAPLDTIVIRVQLNASEDRSPLRYYALKSTDNSSFIVHSQVRYNDHMIIKALWHPSSLEDVPTVKFYVSASCTDDQMARENCNEAKSVSLKAAFLRPWKSVYQSSRGSFTTMYDLYFTDEMNGVAVGEGSGIVRTNDGGKSWIQGDPAVDDSHAYIIAFTGRDTALVSLTNNYPAFTYDGGKTFFRPDKWTPSIIGHQSSSAYYLQSRDIIYTVGWRGNIAKTTDGGQTWDRSGSFNVLNRLNDLIHIGKDTLFTCGTVGFLARTTDAGKTWKQQPLQLNNDLNKIYFVNSSLGFAGGQLGTLIRTTDGGGHWDKISTGIRLSIIAIHFFKNGHGFLVSAGGEIAESHDAGLSWKLILKDNYGAGNLRKVVIKDEKTIFGLQGSSILTYDLTQR